MADRASRVEVLGELLASPSPLPITWLAGWEGCVSSRLTHRANQCQEAGLRSDVMGHVMGYIRSDVMGYVMGYGMGYAVT